jgi:hypothetical protein
MSGELLARRGVIPAMYLDPGMTLGYTVTRAGKTLVYATHNKQYRFTLEHMGQRAEAPGRETLR